MVKRLKVNLIKIKAMGKTNYKDYKAYLKTKTDDELVDIKVDLETKYSKWNKILTYFLVGVIIATLGFLGKFLYDVIIHSFELYNDVEAFIIIKGVSKIFLLIAISLSILLFILYNGLANTKQKLLFMKEYSKERHSEKK
ncbi:hypothetical protein AB3329_01905 [Streptococcus sp. H31]|uniref:hypothetical protein n=1 Tax=Streptococcus huangxiaojuni TaxID=3237239 RepID=UPI0034A21953